MVIDDFEGSNNAVSEGTFYATVGGADVTRNYLGPPGSVLPTDRIMTQLTHHGGGVVGDGDGFGYTWEMNVEPRPRPRPFDTVTDLFLGAGGGRPLRIENNSVDTVYRFFLSLEYQHLVAAFGPDAYVESDLEIWVRRNEVFEAEVISDTLFGNSINNSPEPDSGGVVRDSGIYSLSLILEPGESTSIGFDWTGEAAGIDIGNRRNRGRAAGFLSLDNIVVIPEPSGPATLLGLMALGLVMRKRNQ